MFYRIFQFFLYGSIYTAICAVIMVYQTAHLLHLDFGSPYFFEFVFFSTIASYNFHWILTPFASSSEDRRDWTNRNRGLQVILLMVGSLGTLVYLFPLAKYWLWISVSAGLTFLYSAPKLPHVLADRLQEIAIGKTLYLAFVWTYVTTLLPLFIAGSAFTAEAWLFIGYRFLLIYAVCILFDYRDKELDKSSGIRSIVTLLEAKKTDWLFYFTCGFIVVDTCWLFRYDWNLARIGGLLVPVAILAIIYPYAKKRRSDILYYFVLDGLMMISAFFTSIF